MRKVLQSIMTAICVVAELSVYWFWSAQQLRNGLADWRQGEAAKGLEVSYVGPEIAGFPLALELSLREPVIKDPGQWRWTGPGLLSTCAQQIPSARRAGSALGAGAGRSAAA